MNSTTHHYSFGYKIVDKEKKEAEAIVNLAQNECRPLEVGLYFGEPDTLDMFDSVFRGSSISLNAHLDHRRISIFSVRKNEYLLRHQIEMVLKWGGDYAIDHISHFPMTVRAERHHDMMARLIDSLDYLNSICREYQFPIHIENTFHKLDFYQAVFHSIIENGFDHLHCCFDIGHAKVWSISTMSEWLEFLQQLSHQGIKHHFHLHANSGLMDDHLSLIEAEKMGYTEPDSFTGQWDYFESLYQIEQQFPEARKVFEVPTGAAVENLDYVLQRLADIDGDR